jgi:hypothetical protein
VIKQNPFGVFSVSDSFTGNLGFFGCFSFFLTAELPCHLKFYMQISIAELDFEMLKFLVTI